MAAGGNAGWNPNFEVTTAPKKLNSKRSHDATKQNGPVEGEETLAAAGASADAKESPPEKCRKTCDVQGTSYHGQDASGVISEGLLTRVADNEDSCPWKYVEDNSSETTVNKNQSHKGGNQQKPSKDSLPTQRHRVSFKLSHSRGRLPANSSQEKLGRVVEKDKSHDTTSSRKSDHSRSHDRSHHATSSDKSHHSRSRDRSYDGVQDRSQSGNQHNSQGCDNHEKDYRYLENAKKEDRQQKKGQNDQRSASQQEQAHGGKKNKNKKNQKEGIQNILERLRRERPPKRGEPIELVEVKGDLFSCPATDAMACCVSEDLAMDKGITVRFKEAFRGVGELRAQAKQIGDVATLYRDRNYVYYLIIKKRYFHKPTYQTLESSLTTMKNHMVEHKVTHLSMPTIGCGQHGLVWDVVADIIKNVFHGTGIQITVYHYDGK